MGPSGEDGGSFLTIILGGWPCLALYMTLEPLYIFAKTDQFLVIDLRERRPFPIG